MAPGGRGDLVICDLTSSATRTWTVIATSPSVCGHLDLMRHRGCAPASPRNHQLNGIWVGVVSPPFHKRVGACDGSRLRLPFTSVWCSACDGSRRFGSGEFSEVRPSLFSGPHMAYFLPRVRVAVCDFGARLSWLLGSVFVRRCASPRPGVRLAGAMWGHPGVRFRSCSGHAWRTCFLGEGRVRAWGGDGRGSPWRVIPSPSTCLLTMFCSVSTKVEGQMPPLVAPLPFSAPCC